MAGSVRVAAVDLGASSGRVMLGDVGPDLLRLRATARFPNDPVALPDGLHWDVLQLYARALEGVATAAREAAADGTSLASVGIDSWAVDYGLVKDGRLLGMPFHYRDEGRGAEGPERVDGLVSRADLYSRNGLQHLPFNTLYQLAADDWAPSADRVLLVPDLLGWWLTGVERAERTNASTTGLLDVRSGEWDADLMARLGIRHDLFAPLVEPGQVVGELRPEVAAQLGARLPVVAVGSHDTASAVVGAPLQRDDAAYLSLGTWGLVGVELPAPVLTVAAREANFTNEGGVDGTVRFLTNVMGTWLLSQTLRTWEREGRPADLEALLAAAGEVRADAVPVFDVQDPRFAPPGDMPARIAAWCDDRGVAAPASAPAVVRSIVESLAAAYALALDSAEELSGRRVGVVHVVGGGSRNALLCQRIADRSGREVLAGPVEATALGNVLIQARAAGAVGPSLADLRELVTRTHDLVRHLPQGDRVGR